MEWIGYIYITGIVLLLFLYFIYQIDLENLKNFIDLIKKLRCGDV